MRLFTSNVDLNNKLRFNLICTFISIGIDVKRVHIMKT